MNKRRTQDEIETIDVKQVKEFIKLLTKAYKFIANRERRHYEKAYREITAQDKDEPLLLKPDGTPFLLNVFGYKQLQQIKPIFIAEDQGLLSKEKFEQILNHYAKRLQLSQLQFQRIFCMIDLDDDDLVNWHDFLNYLCQEMAERKILAGGIHSELSEDPIQGPPKFVRNRHGHLISSIAFWPTVTQEKKKDYSAGRFITISKDGYIDVWNLDLKHLYSGNAFSAIPLKITSTCVTKIVPMADINMICVSTMDREIRFYDATFESFRLRTVINEFPNGLVTMEYQFYDVSTVKSWLSVGDTQGNIFVLFFSANSARQLFSQVVGMPYVSVRYHQVLMGAMPGIRVLDFPNVHPTWIETMTYYEELFALVTTCNSPTSAVAVINVYSNSILVRLDVTPGITCAAKLSREKNESRAELGASMGDIPNKKKKHKFSHYLVTAGYSTEVRVWDLDVPVRPKYIIKGTTPQIVLVVVDEEYHDNPWIYTYAREGTITIWDARTKLCLQVYSELLDRLGYHTNLSFCYNPYFKSLVVGSFKLCCLKLGMTFNKDYTAGFTNNRTITVALFSYLFDSVVTCGQDSVVTKWHAFTGRKVLSWTRAHTAVIRLKTVDFGITAATFNPAQSLLATGATDGSIKMWNFHTGVCLRRMSLAKGSVLNVIWLKSRFFGISDEGSYREWEPTVTGEAMKELPAKWHRTVNAACFVPPSTIVLGDIFGELLFSNFCSGKVYKRYYVHEPFRNLTMDVDYKRENRSTRNLVFSKKYHYNVGGVATAGIHCIHYLRKRRQEIDEGSILVALETGMIQLWSAHPKGSLVTAFYAVHRVDDYVVRMTSDVASDYLFTGSVDGYLKLWGLFNFGTQDKVRVNMPKLRLDFAFLVKTRWITRAKKAVGGQKLPLLLNSYRAHAMAISSIIYVDFCKLVITSGTDRSVRYWSWTGQFLNQLGSVIPWVTVDPSRVVVVDRLKIPPDLKRVMSWTTMRVLTNGRRLTEKGDKDPLPTDLQATVHIHRRKTMKKPHGQSLDQLVARYTKLPDLQIEPFVSRIDKQFYFLRHLKPYKMDKVNMIDVAPPLQPKIKKVFMDSLEYMGVPAYTKRGDLKKMRESKLFENMKNRLKLQGILKQIQNLTEEDFHPYAFGVKIRNAVAKADQKSDKARYFEELQGKYLWMQKRGGDAQLKIARMEEMAENISAHKKREAEKERMLTKVRKSKKYLSNNSLTKKMRIGRMRYTIDKLRELEAKLKKVTGAAIEDANKRKKIKEKIGKLEETGLHDLMLEQRKALGAAFWRPLFTSEESDLAEDDK